MSKNEEDKVPEKKTGVTVPCYACKVRYQTSYLIFARFLLDGHHRFLGGFAVEEL